MSTIITRLYASKKEAKQVAGRLKEEKYLARDIDIISKGDDDDMDSLKKAIRNAGVYANAAAIYSERVAGGDVLLVLRAPVGQAHKGTVLVDEYDSIDAGVKHRDVYVGTSGAAALAKRRRHLPNLLSNEQKMLTNDGLVRSGTPFSSLFGIPLLTSGPTGKARLITERTTPFSSFFGLGLLARNSGRAQLVTGNTTPFSSMFGMPLLKRRR